MSNRRIISTNSRYRGQFFLLIALVGLVLVGCGGVKSTEESAPTQAPSFRLPSAQGGEVALQDLVAERPVLLYFHMADG